MSVASGISTSTVSVDVFSVRSAETRTFSGSTETWTTDDPRLTGTGTWDPSEGNPREPFPDYFLNGRFLETDEGTWRQLPVPTVNIARSLGAKPEYWEDDPLWDMVLIGEDGYEGLVFIAQATWTDPGFDVHGFIYDATSPQPLTSTASE